MFVDCVEFPSGPGPSGRIVLPSTGKVYLGLETHVRCSSGPHSGSGPLWLLIRLSTALSLGTGPWEGALYDQAPETVDQWFGTAQFDQMLRPCFFVVFFLMGQLRTF